MSNDKKDNVHVASVQTQKVDVEQKKPQDSTTQQHEPQRSNGVAADRSNGKVLKAPNNDASNTNRPSSYDLPTRPIKRARTAYFIFADEKRPEIQKQHPGGVAVVARILGQMWSNITPEEKQRFVEIAAGERERVAKQMEEFKALHPDQALALDAGHNKQDDPAHLTLPIAKIRKICKLDPEVKVISKEALILITKCAELATSKLGVETVRVAQIQNRRKILPNDVAQVCGTREQFLFLREDVKDLVLEQRELKNQQENTADKSLKSTLSNKNNAANNEKSSKPITSFFAPK